MTQEQGAIPFETVTWDLVPGRTVVTAVPVSRTVPTMEYPFGAGS